jgi:hypothetical protein
MVEADSYLKLFPASILDIYKVFNKLIDILSIEAYSSSPTQLYPLYLSLIMGFWVTCGVKMMSLRHCRGWQSRQTASCIHLYLRHIRGVWAHWHAAHRHSVAALHSYTHTTWLRLWVLAHLSTRYNVIASLLRLTATSSCFPHPCETYIWSVWAHWYMLSIVGAAPVNFSARKRKKVLVPRTEEK